MKKKTLSLLLSLLLIISILPGFTLAAGVETSAAPDPLAQEDSIERFFYDEEKGIRTVGTGLVLASSFTAEELAKRDIVCERIRSGIINWESAVSVSDLGLSVEFCSSCFYGVIFSYPELFYVSSQFGWSLYMQDGDPYCATIKLTYQDGYSQETIDEDIAQFNSVCNEILAGMPDGTTEEILLYFHD